MSPTLLSHPTNLILLALFFIATVNRFDRIVRFSLLQVYVLPRLRYMAHKANQSGDDQKAAYIGFHHDRFIDYTKQVALPWLLDVVIVVSLMWLLFLGFIH